VNYALSYNSADLTKFQELVYNDTGVSVSVSVLEGYIKNFDTSCSAFKLPEIEPKKEICYYAYNYLKDRINWTEYEETKLFRYYPSDITTLRDSIKNATKLSLDSLMLEKYFNLSYFDKTCSEYNYTIYKSSKGVEICSLSTNFELRVPLTSFKYNFDSSIPFPDIAIGDIECSSIDFWKWIFNIKEDNNYFYINGFRVWILIAIGITFLLVMLFKYLMGIGEDED
jgi:hypothetical protein